MGFGPFTVLFAIICIYLVLGCVMDSLSMILLTVPIFLPIVLGMDYWGLSADDKAIWFGMVALVVMEIGLITPPVGTTLNVICGVSKVKMDEVIVGVMPFMIAELVVLALLTLFPSLILVPMKLFI